jgi:hypothetical protein
MFWSSQMLKFHTISCQSESFLFLYILYIYSNVKQDIIIDSEIYYIYFQNLSSIQFKLILVVR